MSSCWKSLTRRKTPDETESKLARVLTLLDLTALGVGSTLGLGVYVLAGSVAYEQAGPAVAVSFALAAIASAFAGLCYAEFAGRVPRAGSAYVYSYVTVGEFVAFTIGWNLILEYVIGTASVARGLSGYLDALINNTMATTLNETMPIRVNFLAEYPDFFACGMVVLLACLLAFGVKESSLLNNIFTCVNMLTVCIVIIAGTIKADPGNWALTDVPENAGVGGFMPYGWAGVMAGAAKCFYGFIGFDVVATTGEEAINPKKNIPLSIIISLVIIFLAYFGVSTVLTMMWPYYLQNPDAPFPHVFEEVGWIAIKWIVTIGAIFALCTSLLGSIFPLPRVLYAMGKDGILFKCFARVNNYTKTPLLASIISGFFSAIMALIFDLHQLIEMMSIGTLLAYAIVAICVLVLRYQEDEIPMKTVRVQMPTIMRQLFNLNFIKEANTLTSDITKVGIVIYCILALITCSVIKFMDISAQNPWTIALLSVLVVILVLIMLSILRQPESKMELSFKVPLVPFIPCISVFFNIYLMFQLDLNTWIRFLVWIGLGYIIYFTYGIRNSTQGIANNLAIIPPPTLNGKKSDCEKYPDVY